MSAGRLPIEALDLQSGMRTRSENYSNRPDCLRVPYLTGAALFLCNAYYMTGDNKVYRIRTQLSGNVTPPMDFLTDRFGLLMSRLPTIRVLHPR